MSTHQPSLSDRILKALGKKPASIEGLLRQVQPLVDEPLTLIGLQISLNALVAKGKIRLFDGIYHLVS